MEKWRSTSYAVEMDIYKKHKCSFWQMWDNCTAQCLNLSVVCEQSRHLSSSHRWGSHPSASQPHSCSNLCYTTEQAMPKTWAWLAIQHWSSKVFYQKCKLAQSCPCHPQVLTLSCGMRSSVTAGQGTAKGSCIFLSAFMRGSSPRSILHSLITWNKNKASQQTWKITFYCDLCIG